MLDMSVAATDTGAKEPLMPRSSARLPQGELLQGTLPLLILLTLATGPNHGFAIARRIQQISKAVLRVEQGSLYPALHRMELDGVIESYWETTENNRKAKYYRLTRRGTRELASETERWNSIAAAVAAVLQEG
jgi:PadR family transcriptional regulator, regulatory protein PadR